MQKEPLAQYVVCTPQGAPKLLGIPYYDEYGAIRVKVITFLPGAYVKPYIHGWETYQSFSISATYYDPRTKKYSSDTLPEEYLVHLL